MLGTKIYKESFDGDLYSKCALWCNENNCVIKENGNYYEVVNIATSNTEDQFKKQRLQNEISSTNLKIAELLGISECAISVDGENQYDVFVDGELKAMNETQFQNYFDKLSNTRSDLLQQYKELK